ncbi:MAG: hypothetical protein HKN77_07650 [Woeseiaceae bacterium]|nr:hypothetical protein [Woeseiaceae bacterium]
MNNKIVAIILVLNFSCGNAVFAQEHSITYVKKNRAIDASVFLAGNEHTMVKLPIRDFGSGTKYTVIFAAPTISGIFTTGMVTTVHSSSSFTPNIQIDGLPGQVTVVDGLNYAVASDGLGGHTFIVTGSVIVTVLIDIGNTIVSITNAFTVDDPQTGEPTLTNLEIGPSANAVPFAQWGRYVDQAGLIKAADDWIDFIRIGPL